MAVGRFILSAGVSPVCWSALGAALVGLLVGCGGDAAGTAGAPQRLAEARQEMVYLGFDEADAIYESVAESSPVGSDAWVEATFGRAVCAQQITPHTAERLSAAAASFESILEQRPDHPVAARAWLNLGRIDEAVDYAGDTADLDAARRRYETVRERFPGSFEAGEATLRLASTFVRPHRPAEMRRGVQVLEGWLAAHPDDPLASGMWQYLAETYQKLGDDKSAVAAMVRADEAGLLLDANPMNQYYFIATLAAQTGQRELAVRYYRRLIEDPAVSVGGRGYTAQRALIEMGVDPPLMPGQTELEPTLQRLRERLRTSGDAGGGVG